MPILLADKAASRLNVPVALIRDFVVLQDGPQWHRSEVDVYFTTLEREGETRLHLASFGSDSRKTQGVSQTFQLDQQRAAQLVQILKKAFPGI